MPKIFLLMLITIAVLLIIFAVSIKQDVNYVRINNQDIRVEIADSADERERGLMFRESLDEKTGMLFIFDDSGVLNFWMKNTLIPLDIIFIDEDWRIINIARNALPCRQEPCAYYSSEIPAKYVLEINGREADKLGIKDRDEVEINAE